jgi:hypothetical protein
MIIGRSAVTFTCATGRARMVSPALPRQPFAPGGSGAEVNDGGGDGGQRTAKIDMWMR